jgi:NADH:ubiquinone oxidoreductase subunit K
MGGATAPLAWYLILGAAFFCVGIFGVLANRNLIVIIMSIQLMFNAVVLNIVAFARFLEPTRVTGKTFAVVVYASAVAEAALGLALIISIWRTQKTVAVEEIDLLHD